MRVLPFSERSEGYSQSIIAIMCIDFGRFIRQLHASFSFINVFIHYFQPPTEALSMWCHSLIELLVMCLKSSVLLQTTRSELTEMLLEQSPALEEISSTNSSKCR